MKILCYLLALLILIPTLASAQVLVKDHIGPQHRTNESAACHPYGVRVTGTRVRLRRGPGTEYEIFADPSTGKPIYPLEGDVLELIGHTDEWNKVRFMGETLYISKLYSEYYNREAKNDLPFAEIAIPFEGEESSFIVLINETQAAVFLKSPSGEMTFITEGAPDEIHVYPEIETVRYYSGNAIGIEEERIYVTEHGQLNAIWTRTVKPLGNIREQDEISVETICTHTANGKTTKCNESDIEGISEVVRDVEEYDIMNVSGL